MTTLLEAGGQLRAGKVSSAELVARSQAEADRDDARLGVFAQRWPERSAAAARAADDAFAAGIDRGPLQGIPVAVKDLVSTADAPARAGSRLLGPEWGARHGDAVCVARLRAAGAIPVGATTTSEFGLGAPPSAEGSGLPVPRNPWDTTRWTGGSSSGSASAVLTGMALGAIGTDSGGSVRMPAAFCGVTGFKPGAGRVPTDGVYPLGWSTDTVGVLAPTAADCATLFDVIADAAPVPRPSGGLSGRRVGVDRLTAAGGAFVDPAWDERWAELVAVLTDSGARVQEIELPLVAELNTASTVITLSEALALHRGRLGARWAEYLPDTRATLALAAGFSGADYVQAQRVRAEGRRRLAGLFCAVDLVLTPTAAMTATPFARLPDMVASGEFAAVHAAYWNVPGNPALSVPVGPGADGLPLGLQIVGPPGGDETVLAAGAALQERTRWHTARPPRPAQTPGASSRRSHREKDDTDDRAQAHPGPLDTRRTAQR